MQPELNEDFLEAVLNIKERRGHSATLAEVAGALKQDPSRAMQVLLGLEEEGLLVREADDTLELTPQGREIAERVCRKHRVLECFLEEMLGIDGKSASMQACHLEHQVSDEAIERLSSIFGIRRRHGRSRGKRGGAQVNAPSLLDFKEGDEVLVTMIQGARKLDRLSALGILPGERVLLRRKLPNNAVVIQVKDCDIALSAEVAGSIFVEKPE